MDNLKVKVENNIDELVSLFGDLGCKYFNHTVTDKKYMIFQNGKCFFVKSRKEFNMYDCKELTTPQLRDMVVLERNDVGDAQFIDDSMYKWYVGHDGKRYRFQGDKFIYQPYSVTIELKPIERKEMKEFLVNHDNKWTSQLLDADTEENSYRVAVPSGVIEARLNKGGSLNFIREDGCWMNNATKGEWWGARSHDCHELVWQRSETKSLNDTYAEIEQVRQEIEKVTIDELKHRVGVEPNKTTVDAMKEADKMFADAVNNPSHYSDSTIECIDAMEAMLSPQEFIGYIRGNMFKYQWRYQKKNGIEDLQKSEWYLKKLIEKEMKNEDE